MRRASTIGTNISSPVKLKLRNMALTAINFSVSTPISGTSRPNASPLASDIPMRRPVYDPGPVLTATASILSSLRVTSSMACATNGARSVA